MKRFLSTIILIGFMLFSFCSCTNNTGGKQIKVGVIDTSISQETVKKYKINNINDLIMESLIEDDTHGSLIVDIITNNSKYYDIYYAAAMDSTLTGEIKDVILSIDWCIQNNVDVICMSFATLKDDKELKDKIEEAIDKEIIIVASCINNSELTCYPAMYDGVISVSDGINTNASISFDYENMEDYMSCSELTAYVCGRITNELSKGNNDVFEILKDIREN